MARIFLALALAADAYAFSMKVAMSALVMYLIDQKGVKMDDIPDGEIRRYTAKAIKKMLHVS